MNGYKIRIVFCWLFIALCAAEGGAVTISSGGTVQPGFIDIKGEPVVGAGSGIGLGGIYLYGPSVQVGAWPYGTVPLSINRDANGNDIDVTWDAGLFPTPDIYVLTGPGSGAFSNIYNQSWIKVATGGGLVVGIDPAQFSYAEGKLVHKNQQARGDGENYYRGLQVGIDVNGVDPNTGQTIFPQAPAVGKVNVVLDGNANVAGYNLSSVPLMLQSQALDSVFGSGAPWQSGDQILIKKGASPAYLTAVYDSQNYPNAPWRDAFDAAKAVSDDRTFDIDPKLGYFIKVNNPKTISLVGGLLPSPINIGVWAAGYTILGIGFPISLDLNASGLLAKADEGDAIFYKSSPLSPAYNGAIKSGGAWRDVFAENNPPPAEIMTLKLPKGYFFSRKGNSAFSWPRTLP